MTRKRLLMIGALTTIILMVAWASYFLLNFDLNNYRMQAEKKLSSLLSLSVKIGAIDYHLRDTSLALHVAGLKIGDENAAVQIETPNILINLKWWGLLERDFKFSKISLNQPHILVRVAMNEQSGNGNSQLKSTPMRIDQALLKTISIDNLEILDGAMQIEISRSDQTVQQVDIANLSGKLSGISMNQTSQLTMQGELGIPGQAGKSQWQIHGQSTLEFNERAGLVPHYNFDLKVKALDLEATRGFLPERPASFSIAGTSDLHLQIAGAPDGSIDFQTELSSKNIILLPGPAYTRPILFKSLLASGQLQTHSDHPGINNISLTIDGSRLAGNIDWTPYGQSFSATVTLLDSNMTVRQAKQWLPESQKTWHALRQGLGEQGSLQIEQAKFTLFEEILSGKKWRIDQLKGELRKIVWDHKKGPAAEISSLPFSFADNRWQISNGRGQLGSLQLTADGTGEYKEDSFVLTSLDFTGEALPNELLNEWQLPQHSFSTNGNIGIKGHLEGPLHQLSLDLQADLSQFSLSHPAGLKLTSVAEDNFTLHGSVSPGKISIDHAALRWSDANGHLSGSYLTENPDSLTIDALLSINDLTKLAGILPLLDKLQLRGQADLNIHQRGLPENNRPEMILTLRDAGLRATHHIADLSQINGRVQLTPNGLKADNLRVHLGQSSLTVQAQLADFSNPNLVLDVKAPSIRADELIFHSDKAMLRDIDGHLEIDRDGLSFAPVDVHLDGGTNASVRGTISFHPPFDVMLDITSEFARISEVISLWSNRSEISKKRSPAIRGRAEETKPKATIRINALVKNGDLYGMSFHDASGVIVPTRGRLNIHPLDFSVGEGFCNAQILTDFSPRAPTLLRISGHAEDVDALEVYRELLNQKNILRGKLRGDFYLSGEIGAHYLPSSYGNFNIQVHDGVLHQFQFLSKVFSLLNVSQILALQLPDMDANGMPFDILSANLRLEKGILKSEDLKIKSEAMNQLYSGQLNLMDKEIDLDMTIHPLGTVDKIVSRIPVAGWLLTGKDKALLAAHFSIKGKTDNVSVEAMSLDSLSGPTLGLLKRTLTLPYKLFDEPQILWGGESNKEEPRAEQK